MHTSPPKGKAREDATWQLGWWELYPLVDGPRSRPLAWSSSSVIYTAHPSQPVVVARHFPSNRQFFLPLPPTVASSPVSFEPPSVICVSPGEDFLFAFTPSREGPGVGCIWHKGYQIDGWTPVEWWNFAKGAGVVCAEWMFAERPWVVGESGAPYRLPPKGPTIPMNSPTLLLVTETHFLHVCVLPPTYPSMKIARMPLLQFGMASQGGAPPPPKPGQSEQQNQQQANEAEKSNDMNPEDVPPSGNGGRRVCVHAAIGFSYNEPHFVIAMRSKYLPPQHFPSMDHGTGFDAMDIDLDLNMGTQGSSGSGSTVDGTNDLSMDWEQWGEDCTIDLTLVQFDFNGSVISLHGRPIQPIFKPGSQLTDLRFFAVPPETATASPTISRDPRRPGKEKESNNDKGVLYLATTFMDFDDYSSLPKSEISLYTLALSVPSPGRSPETQWVARLEKTRTFDQGALAFLAPGPARSTAFAGFLDTVGYTPRQAKKGEIPIGSISVLQLPDLSNDDRWEHSQILSSPDGIGRDIPIGVVLSPNSALLCSTSPSPNTTGYRISVHPIPRRQHPSSQNSPARSDLSRALVQAICARKSPSDVIHALTHKSVSLETVTSTLFGASNVLEASPVGLNDIWLSEILGVATEVYLTRAKDTTDEAEKDALTERWKAAHDICSVSALNAAFEDCRESESGYDLDAIWQLIGLTSWLITLLERISKQCIFIAEGNPSPKPYQLKAGDIDPLSYADAAVLLHLVHPYALKSLSTAVAHVRRFQEQVSQAHPKTDNALLSKEALMDVIDSSGVILGGLTPLLDECKKVTAQNPADELRRALVSCTITPALRPLVRQVIDKVLASLIISRPKLFIKPVDLNFNLDPPPADKQPWDPNTDIVSKGMLLRRPGGINVVCVRCGGKSETILHRNATTHVSFRWKPWETLWASRCVCGGAWIRSPV